MTSSLFVGVDGCPGGWFSVGLDANGGLARCGVYDTFERLLTCSADASLILVDIPIGLPEGADERACDTQARKKLKGRRSSVFRTPTRLALERAISVGGYDDPGYRASGKRLSQQTFNIAQKIAQVDSALHLRGAGARPPVREVHPEVCFWALNNCKPMSTNKKKPRGSEERIRTLDKACFSEAESIYQGLVKAFPRSQVAKDDILDALAAAVTGWLGTTEGKGKLAILPYDPPPKDCRGLPMEMVYCEPDAQSNPG